MIFVWVEDFASHFKLCYAALPYITLPYIKPPYITLHYITLDKPRWSREFHEPGCSDSQPANSSALWPILLNFMSATLCMRDPTHRMGTRERTNNYVPKQHRKWRAVRNIGSEGQKPRRKVRYDWLCARRAHFLRLLILILGSGNVAVGVPDVVAFVCAVLYIIV